MEEESPNRRLKPTGHVCRVEILLTLFESWTKLKVSAAFTRTQSVHSSMWLTSYSLEAISFLPVVFIPSIATTWGNGNKQDLKKRNLNTPMKCFHALKESNRCQSSRSDAGGDSCPRPWHALLVSVALYLAAHTSVRKKRRNHLSDAAQCTLVIYSSRAQSRK